MKPYDQTKYMTVAQAANKLDLSQATVYRMVHRGKLPASRMGAKGRLLVDRAAVQRVAEQETQIVPVQPHRRLSA
jgi:excisionase family DNA binding protein